MTQINLFIQQKWTQRNREQTYGCQEGSKYGTDGLEVRDQETKTIIYRMDKQQDSIVYHRELYSVSCDKPQRKNTEKNVHLCVYISIYILNHFAAQQKLTPHCKSPIHQ